MGDQVEGGENQSWLVPDGAQAVRLDGFLRQCLPHLSRQELHRAIAENLFLHNGRVARKGDRVSGGDRLSFVGPANMLSGAPPPAPQLEIRIIYEDESILAVDKPAGLPTHGFSGRHGATLANFLAAQRPGILNVGRSRWEPGLVHRLDIETSGVVLVAKTQFAFDQLRDEGQLHGQTRRMFFDIAEAGERATEAALDSGERRVERQERREDEGREHAGSIAPRRAGGDNKKVVLQLGRGV